ncbi:MAG TPA: CDP-diacylglycerol--serine O-phosphatidyltransferase [Gammaproteobacteria bacterium]|nr:CDP-diacylglycerol--serine O-phosphatidyltransferase [Gammaproteobacteria bacterium]
MNDDGKRPRRRGIYLLPNLFTTAALFAGFYGIIAAMKGHFEAASVAVFVAMVLDGLDGRVARLTNTQSDFGTQYDSLSDMLCFGLAPALIVYQWSLSGMGKLGWLAAFLFTACAALRLARFNTQVEVVDKRYFQGLPSPAAAGLAAGLVWVGFDNNISGEALRVVAFTLTVAGAILMVSNVRYHSFKDLDLKHKVPFMAGLAIVMLFVFIAVDPPQVLFLMLLLYALSGPVLTLFHRRRLRDGGAADGSEREE